MIRAICCLALRSASLFLQSKVVPTEALGEAPPATLAACSLNGVAECALAAVPTAPIAGADTAVDARFPELLLFDAYSHATRFTHATSMHKNLSNKPHVSFFAQLLTATRATYNTCCRRGGRIGHTSYCRRLWCILRNRKHRLLRNGRNATRLRNVPRTVWFSTKCGGPFWVTMPIKVLHSTRASAATVTFTTCNFTSNRSNNNRHHTSS